MTESQINQLSCIAIEFNNIRTDAKNATTLIANVLNNAAYSLKWNEKDILNAALKILSEIDSNHSIEKASEYFKKQQTL